MIVRPIIYLFLLLAVFSISAYAKDDKSNLPEISPSIEEGGFGDVTLSIRNVSFDGRGNCTVRAYGLFNGKITGIAVTFRNGMKPGVTDGKVNQDGFMKDGIIYSSLGVESDAFLLAVAKLYRVPLKNPIFKKYISLTVFSLGGNPRNIRNERLEFKVFLNDKGDDDSYAELYINIDITKGILEFFEKDPEYRKNIIKALVEIKAQD